MALVAIKDNYIMLFLNYSKSKVHLLRIFEIYNIYFLRNEIMIANTPKPPYYVVIFSSLRTEVENGYSEMADKLVELASKQDGFLGIESVRDELGITVSYWKDLESIRKWKQNSEHLIAQKNGREIWYSSFKTRIGKIEHDYDFNKM